MNSRGFVPTKILLTFLLLSLSGFFFSCGGNEEETSKAGGGTPVHITHPVLMDLNDYLTLNGNTVFLKKEIIRATFDGFIEKAFKNIGDGVKPGDVLFQLKTKELAASDSINVNLGRQQFKGTVDCKAGSTGTLTELDFHEGDYVTA
ncbi:MAG: hypothetical protein KGJ59_14630, partial [Bacteroidota bacterium]|nr:hypothetical protein [Bacteroidota bacterium]